MRWRILRLRARETELLVLVDQRTRSLSEEKARAEEARARAEEARAEAERHREVAERATAQAEEASRTKSRFLANVSHELRTPLNAIIGYSEMLSEEASDEGRPALVRDLEKIRFAALHQLDLINSVLDLAKIEAGRLDLDVETFPVVPLVEETAAIVKPLLDRNRNTLVIRTSPEAGFTMRSDPMKTRQCLFNLLSNACKFTEGGSVELDVARFEEGGRVWVSFRVKDTGIGIPGEKLTRLFEPFAQADSSVTRRFGGTGLGLSITRQLCELMGGRVIVESVPGTGSTFEIRLPADVAA
jgi:signal transduction histidine kinase